MIQQSCFLTPNLYIVTSNYLKLHNVKSRVVSGQNRADTANYAIFHTGIRKSEHIVAGVLADAISKDGLALSLGRSPCSLCLLSASHYFIPNILGDNPQRLRDLRIFYVDNLIFPITPWLLASRRWVLEVASAAEFPDPDISLVRYY